MARNKKMKKVLKWIMLLSWIIVIFYFSHQPGSVSTQMSDPLSLFVQSIFKDSFVSSLIIDFTFLVRKSAHFFVYFVLGVLSIWLALEYFDSWKKVVWVSFVFCFLYACSDEIHQLFIVGRSGRIFDVLIDCCGTSLALIVSSFFHNLHKKNS